MKPRGPGLERRAVAAVGLTIPGVVLLSGWGALAGGGLVGRTAPLPLAVAAVGLVLAVALGLVVLQWLGRERSLLAVGLGAVMGLGAWGAGAAAAPLAPVAGAALAVTGLLAAVALPRLAEALPESLDGALPRRRWAALLWALAVLLALFQTVRFAAFMVDPEQRWGSAFPFDAGSVRHMCLAAYVYAADLALTGAPSIYDPEIYRSFASGGGPGPAVAGLAPYIEDAFLYPPPFLLLPAAGLALTRDYLALRTGWYVLQGLLFLAVAVALARRTGGPEGLRVGLLLPVLWLSIPTMFNLQYGQFHLAALTLSMAALWFFEARRPALGGLCLGIAAVAKVFPGILLLDLLLRRRFRAAGWTVAALGALALAALLSFGPAPFVEYLSQRLGPVASGEAVESFATDFSTVINNVSAYSAVVKLSWLGVPGMSTGLAEAVSWLYSLLPLAAAWWVRKVEGPFLLRVQVGLGLVNLAALRSPNAPSIYVLAGTLWLLVLLTPRVAGSRRKVAGLALAWVLFLGLPPLPVRSLLLVASLVMQSLCLAVSLWAVLGARSAGHPQGAVRRDQPRERGPLEVMS
jgi:hypothetical protein